MNFRRMTIASSPPKKHLAKVSDDFQRLQERAEMRLAAWQAASAALAACEGWLRDGRPHGTVLQDHETEVPKLAKGEDIFAALDKVRRRGREIKASIHTTQSSCYPSSYCKQRMREQIEQLAQRGCPDVTMLVEHDREIAWPVQHLRSSVIGAEQAR